MKRRRGGGRRSGNPAGRHTPGNPAGRHTPGNPGDVFGQLADYRDPLASDLARLMQPTGISDPRRLGGSMAGPGGPHDRDSVVLDMTDAVLLESTEVAAVVTYRDGRPAGSAAFVVLHGRVNKTSDQVSAGYVLHPDASAAIITELLGLADRDGELLASLVERFAAMHAEGTIDLISLRQIIDAAIVR